MKHALLVGVNDYPGSENDLHGCLNDITNVYDVLVKYFGFSPGNIRLLQDSRATKEAIQSELTHLVGKAAKGDTIVFHYSGHGSQVRDMEGDELADGKDEIICPYDFDWSGTYLSDDDFSDIFKGLRPDAHLEVILDSCHSGTGTREIVLDRRELGRLGELTRGTDGCRETEKAIWSSACCLRNRYIAPPADIARRADEIFGDELPLSRIGLLAKIKSGDPLNHVLWAACRSDQFSADADIGGTPNGAFSYFFCKHIRDTGGKIMRSDLLKRVRASLKHEGYSQIPQLESQAAEMKKTVFENG
jgi:hypothetical protein